MSFDHCFSVGHSHNNLDIKRFLVNLVLHTAFMMADALGSPVKKKKTVSEDEKVH